MHPRLTVVGSVFRGHSTLAEDLEALRSAGAERVGLGAAKLSADGAEAGLEAVRRAGIVLTHLLHAPLVPLGEPDRRPQAAGKLMASLDLAAAAGARCVYGPTGGAPGLDWDEAAGTVAAAVAPALEHAQRQGVALLTEPTISLAADISMLHSLADTVDLADRTGLGICVDVQHCWHERGLRAALRRAGDRIGLVQLSDWVPGNRHHFRAVPGDGAIPLEQILGWILDTGYTGLFDLELFPEPGVPERDTIARGIERAETLLTRLGV